MAYKPIAILGAVALAIAATLQGCGGGGGSTPAPTPVPKPPPSPPSPSPPPSPRPTPRPTAPTPKPPAPTPPTPPAPPTPPSPGPPPPYGCGPVPPATSSLQDREYTDQDLIDEFNDHCTGIAISMIASETWLNPGSSHSGMDSAGFFDTPPKEYKGQSQQAMTIVTKQQPMTLYGAYGAYGVAFHITEKSLFWKYFQVYQCGYDKKLAPEDTAAGKGPCGCYNVGTPPVWTCYHGTGCWQCQNDTIVGGPGDGMTAPPRPDCRVQMEKAGKDYKWFRDQKNKILGLFNTAYHSGHDYNEFDTNGLSSSDLAGVFFSEVSQDIHPQDDKTLCNFLMKVNPARKTPWPVYTYKWNSLSIKKHLNCPSAANNTEFFF